MRPSRLSAHPADPAVRPHANLYFSLDQNSICAKSKSNKDWRKLGELLWRTGMQQKIKNANHLSNVTASRLRMDATAERTLKRQS